MLKFSKPQQYIISSLQSICLFLAGVGSGKTYIIGFLSGYFIKYFPEVPGFIGANTYMQLSQSTLFRVKVVWEEIYGWKENQDYVISKRPPKAYERNLEFTDYRSIVSFKSGAVVFVGSLDNAKAHDGKEFAWAFLDETKDSREEDVKDVIQARLRSGGIYIGEDEYGDPKLVSFDTEIDDETGKEIKVPPRDAAGELLDVFNPLYILTSPAKVDWINEWFELPKHQNEIQRLIYNKDEFFTAEEGDKCVVISSTYHNEENLPKGYIQKQIANRTEEKAKMLIYGNPFVRSGGEFYSGFERLKHVKPTPYLPGLPIHLSLDQNVVPYITGTLYQIEELPGNRKRIRQFDEICLPNPRNKTSKLCLEFIKRHGAKAKHGLYYYGDPSGRKRDTRTNEHDYLIVERLLRRYLNNRSDRVPYVHPPVLKRKDFSNNIFEGVYEQVEFQIAPKCKHSIADFEFVKEDVNGKKAKHKKKDPVTGAQYEEYGHTSDSWDYFICEALGALFTRHFK